jgi:hypothetical protein
MHSLHPFSSHTAVVRISKFFPQFSLERSSSILLSGLGEASYQRYPQLSEAPLSFSHPPLRLSASCRAAQTLLHIQKLQ